MSSHVALMAAAVVSAYMGLVSAWGAVEAIRSAPDYNAEGPGK